MCGGTWPPKRCEPSTKTGKRISLDGAADLIDAAVSLPRRFRVSYLITTRKPEGLRLWGKRNNLGRPTTGYRCLLPDAPWVTGVAAPCSGGRCAPGGGPRP